MHAFAHKPKAILPTVSSVIGTGTNIREQQADHTAEVAMHMPAPTLQRAGQEQERAPVDAPAIVHDVVRSAGSPLEAEPRRSMESRFGHNFSRVRVHTDARAAESAQAVHALAYTFGTHVVFAPGKYAPATGDGQWLLAHELAHVLQEADAPVLQRKPDADARAKAQRDKHYDELARDPADAHKAWSGLTQTERDTVTKRMRLRYGDTFAQEFLAVVKTGKPRFDVNYYQPGSGPTREKLLERGYRRAGPEHTGNAGFNVEVWVHPTGMTVRKDISTWKFSTSEDGKKPRTKTDSNAEQPPAKKPPVEAPGPPAETTPRHEQALDFLEDMEKWNTELQSLCEADPFDLSASENAVIEWNFAREAVRDFKDLDWTGIYPDFWNEVTELSRENLDLRRACCKHDPKNFWFDCGNLPPP